MRANAMRTTSPSPAADRTRDRGTVLPLALVVSVVLSVVVVSIAGFVTTGLRYGKVVEDRADRLAAADGGMRYAVERLRLGASRICATSGGDVIDPPDINGTTVTVRCGQVGDGFDDVNGWALILTGEEIPSSCTGTACARIATQGGASVSKLVGGPVYMSKLAFDAQAPIEFRYSQLLHTEADCATSAAAVPSNVTFDSTSLGLACTERPWSADADPVAGMFSEPNIGVLPLDSGPSLNPAPTIDGNGCKVFEPGYYNIAPVLGSHNYFKSGNYVFDGFNLEVKQAKVTAGRAAADGADGAAQFIPNTTCNTARNADTNGITTAGVTFYLKNGARFTLDAHGQLEILRRKQGKSYVSIHVLDGSLTSTVNVIEQGPGNNKDMAVHGLVWAPEARMTFSNVTNTANGQLLGGAVLSNIKMDSSASAVGFIIAVEASDLHGKLLLDSVAELDGKTTTIRSIVDYRPSTNYAAVTSWRVVE
jgi:Tfp pilus assembly protein PilX